MFITGALSTIAAGVHMPSTMAPLRRNLDRSELNRLSAALRCRLELCSTRAARAFFYTKLGFQDREMFWKRLPSSRTRYTLLMIGILCFFLLMINGYANLSQWASRVEPMKEMAVDTEISALSSNCPVTPREQISQGPLRILYGPYPSRHWIAGSSTVIWEVTWNQPSAGRLEIRGHRLDGEAPSFSQDGGPIRQVGPQNPQPRSSIAIPTPGCWEIEVRAGEHTLRFVILVYPRAYQVVGGRERLLRSDLEDIVINSDAILLAEVESWTPDRPGFVWRTVRTVEVWKAPVSLGFQAPMMNGERVDLLQEDDEQSLQNGQKYVLFLRAEPGKPWRILFRRSP